MVADDLRSAVHPVRDGVRMLRPEPDIPYRDGAEERLWDIVRAADDLGSESTGMLAVSEGWAESYHTHPARANVLRAIDIAPGTRVLEIGSGCGPNTRYLGETGALVDAVEPVLVRARVGRERTRDLPDVQVFCGNLEDVPASPVYDLVVVVGVLEYVAGGARDPQPYLDFLTECRRRLRPGGALVLAIENKLGVKYLTGTAEDHSGRMHDSVEDYPRGTPARTFSATALLDLVTATGFAPRLLGVFPDYKHTRVVFDTDRLAAVAPDLVEHLPVFPSRYAGTRSTRLASEARVWGELVRDGLGAHFANSFLVLAPTTDGDGGPDLWPADRLARYFSVNRQRGYAATTTLTAVDGTVHFDRRYSDEPGPLITAGVTAWDYVPGRSFSSAYAAADEEGRRDLLQRWLRLVDEAALGDDGQEQALDAIPTNVLVADDGRLELIDSEFHDRVPREHVVRRGLYWFAVHLVRGTPPEWWAPARTIGEVLQQVAGLAGVELDDVALSTLLDDEARFQVAVTTHHLGPDAVAESRARLQEILDSDVWDTPLGRRLHHDLDDTRAALATEQDRTARLTADGADLRARYAEAAEARQWLRERLARRRAEVRRLRRTVEKARRRARTAEGELAALRRSRVHRLAEQVRTRLPRRGSS